MVESHVFLPLENTRNPRGCSRPAQGGPPIVNIVLDLGLPAAGADAYTTSKSAVKSA